MPRSLCLPFMLTTTMAALLPCQQESAIAHGLQARVDPRVELLSIVFRMAGNPEYRQGKVDAYTEAVESAFGKWKDHAVVKRAARLRRAHGVSYDAVMSMAVHLDSRLQPAVAFDAAERLDERWPRSELNEFGDELRDFARKSKFADFVEQQQPLYDLAARRMQAVLDERAKLAWFDGFFGARPTAQFEFCLGMLNGGACYGPSVRLADGTEQLYCVLGVWATDADGKPKFDDSVVPTVVHEFCHSYCNALVDAHLAELEGAAGRLWPHVEAEMRQQAYGNPRTMLCESLVRACVVRYVLATGGETAAAQETRDQVQRSFLWTGALAKALGDYEAQRDKYATLDAFMPQIATCLGDYEQHFAAEMAQLPRVVRMTPANGAADVDPALQAIVITFDRPMRDRSWAVVGGGPHFPKTGKPAYDAARMVLTLPVELKPDWQYEFWLNRGKYDSFQSEDGRKLRPVHVTFKTRK